MSVAALYVLHGLVTPSGFISQVENARPRPGIQIVSGVPAGLPGSRFSYNMVQMPEFGLETSQIKSVLDLCGTSLYNAGAAGNSDLLFKATAHGGSRVADASSAHIRLRAPKAIYVPQSISVSDGQQAVMTANVICSYDGTNAPITPTGSVALSGTPSHAEHFTVGPCEINTVAVNGIQDISLDFGIRLIQQRGDGEQFLSWICESEAIPVVTIRTTSNPWATFGLQGLALTGLELWLRSCDRTARVSNATEGHILFTATAGLITIDDSNAGGNQPGITTIRCTLDMPDATTRALLVDTTAAIA